MIHKGQGTGLYKPEGQLEVDRLHPLARNLVNHIFDFPLSDFAAPAQLPLGERFIDQYGSAYQKDAVTTDQWEYSGNNNKITGDQARTYLLVVRRNASYGNARILDFGGAGNGGRFTVRYDTGNALRFEIQGTGYTSSLVPSTGTPYVLVIRSTTDQIGGASLFLNGVKEDCSGGTTVINTGNTYWRFMAQTGLVDDLYCCFGWNRALSDAEVRSLSKNPYQFLRRTYIYAPIVTAGGSFTLSADSGSYLYTGTAAAVEAQFLIAGDSGSYTYSGATLDLNRGFYLAGDSGSYVYSGTVNSIVAGRSLTADGGSYTYSGTVVTLTFAGAGAFTLEADSGSYTYAGTANALTVARVLSSDSGAYTYTGAAIALNYGRTLAANSGSYAYTGAALGFSKTSVLAADSGIYTYTGLAATLDYSGASVWTKQSDSVTSWADQPNNTTTWTPQADNTTIWTEQ